jgi:hypothetical protein
MLNQTRFYLLLELIHCFGQLHIVCSHHLQLNLVLANVLESQSDRVLPHVEQSTDTDFHHFIIQEERGIIRVFNITFFFLWGHYFFTFLYLVLVIDERGRLNLPLSDLDLNKVLSV